MDMLRSVLLQPDGAWNAREYQDGANVPPILKKRAQKLGKASKSGVKQTGKRTIKERASGHNRSRVANGTQGREGIIVTTLNANAHAAARDKRLGGRFKTIAPRHGPTLMPSRKFMPTARKAITWIM
jgi:hypothetical protein